MVWYGMTVFVHCPEYLRIRVDSTLNSMLKSVAYNSVHSSSDNLVGALGFPNLYKLFKHTVVIGHFWESSFLTLQTPARSLRHNTLF